MRYLLLGYITLCIISLSGCMALNGSLTVKHNQSGAEVKVSDEGLEIILPSDNCIEVDSFGACVK